MTKQIQRSTVNRVGGCTAALVFAGDGGSSGPFSLADFGFLFLVLTAGSSSRSKRGGGHEGRGLVHLLF